MSEIEIGSEVEVQKSEQQDGGLKEMIYQIFDAVLPADSGNVAFGINDFQEKGETFRQMVDVAVDDNDSAKNDYIAGLLEAKDAKISELNAEIIRFDTDLQEAVRKEKQSTSQQKFINEQNDMLANLNIELNNKCDELRDENETLGKAVQTFRESEEEIRIKLVELQEQLKAKDEQISKLTEEINKPKPSGIILPNQAKPSATLQQMIDAAKNKSVKTQVELALSGENFRGKVLITPPSLGGSEKAAETFQDEVAQADVIDSGFLAPQVPTVAFPSEEESNGSGLPVDADGAVRSDDAPATWKELQALEARIEERLYRLEQSALVVA